MCLLLQNWKKGWFVLRGDRLSSYKDHKEYKVHRQIFLSELTAVASLKDAKKDNVFGLFSPSRNYHLQAESQKEAEEWVELIRKAATLVEGEEELLLSPTINGALQSPTEREMRTSSSPEFSGNTYGTVQPMAIGGLSSYTLDYSGADIGSCSSLSDGARISQLSLSHPDPLSTTTAATGATANTTPGAESKSAPAELESPKQGVARNETGLSSRDLEQSRTVWHGYLYCLKSKGGVKQWKKLWVVLRPVNITFYKSEEVATFTPIHTFYSANIVQ